MASDDPRQRRTAGRRFHLKERLGGGTHGTVYRAEQESTGGFRRRVALKVLNTQAAGNPQAGRRLRDEARILGRLQHRGIVNVLDLVIIDGQWVVVMDHVPGHDLDRLLAALVRADRLVPVAAALEIGAVVADALDAAYTARDDDGRPLAVIHRDVKPSNILLTGDGDVKMLDFGVARMNLDLREARTGALVGTERYMGPERLLREGDTHAGDVYATAATVVELLLRRPMGTTPILPEKHGPFVARVLDDVRERLPAGAAADELVAVLGAALDAEPGRRPTGRRLADALEALSRRFDDEPLRPFARRFVPSVDELLGRKPQPATGVLEASEEAASQGPDTSGEAGSTLPELLDTPPGPPARGLAPRRLWPLVMISLGATTLGLLGLTIALLAVLLYLS